MTAASQQRDRSGGASERCRPFDSSRIDQHYVDAALSRSALLKHTGVAAILLAICSLEPVSQTVGLGPGQLAVLLLANLLPGILHQIPAIAAAGRRTRLVLLLGFAHLNLVLIALAIALAGRPVTPLWAFYFAHVVVLASAFGQQPYFVGFVILVALSPGAWFEWIRPAASGTSPWLGAGLFAFVSAWLYVLAGGLVDRTLRLRARAEQAERQRALAEQREHLSREIHDGVGAELTASILIGNAARRLLACRPVDRPVDEAGAMLDGMVERLRRALAEIRQALWSLDPAGGTAEELLARIHRQLGDVCQTAGLAFSSRLRVGSGAESLELPAPVKQHAFRVAQEAVTNVLRHSGASAVSLELEVGPERLLLSISDDGRGAGLPAVEGKGLGSMRARAGGLGGRLDVRTPPAGTGLEILLELPLAGRPPPGENVRR